MSFHRRTELTALALVLTIALPVPAAMARSANPLPRAAAASGAATDAVAAQPDALAADAQADEALAIALAEPQGRPPSGVAGRLADWVSATDDNGELPYLIVDKLGARIFAFDSGGLFLGSAPVLVGLARGDDSAPGIGDLKLAQIASDQRTTPAGRFVASFCASAGHGTMLWVDLPDAISLHPVMSVNAGEHRLERIKSADPTQHRISYGCINVPKAFYDGVVLSALHGGSAVVYVLPDTKTVGEVFPAFAAADAGGPASDPPAQQLTSADLAAEPAFAETGPSRPDPTGDGPAAQAQQNR